MISYLKNTKFQLNQIVGIFSAALLLCLVGFWAFTPIKNLDIWFHLGAGKLISATKIVPLVDIFSFTRADHQWINHEWLFQIIVYFFHSLGEFKYLTYLRLIMTIGIFVCLLSFDFKKSWRFSSLISLLCVLYTYQIRYVFRPEIFSALFVCLFFIILYRYKFRHFWVLIALQLLWANIHGFFILGPIMVVLFFLGSAFNNSSKQISNHEIIKQYGLLLLALLAVSACNPHFLKGLIYPVSALFALGDSSFLFADIRELRPFITLDSIFQLDQFVFYKILFVFSLSSFFMNKNRDWRLVILWLFFCAFSLIALRNILFFVIIAHLVLVANISQGEEKRWSKVCKFCLMLFLAYSFISEIQFFNKLNDEQKHSLKEGILIGYYPHEAVRFLHDNKIEGRLFNDFNSGAYLIGNVYPQLQVFIDGRTELYGDQLLKDYIKIYKGDEVLFQHYDRQYDFSGIFLSSTRNKLPQTLVKHLLNNKEWVLVYFQKDAMIFVPDDEKNQQIIVQHGIDSDQIKLLN